MSPKAVIIVVLGIMYCWVIVSTMPYRRQVQEEKLRTDYFVNLDQKLYHTERYYQAMLADPKADQAKITDLEEEIGQLKWAKHDLVAAMEAFQKVTVKRKLPDAMQDKTYNEPWIKSNLHLAGIYRDLGNWDIAEKTYKEILDYDLKFGAQSTKVARDLNNLGLLEYMIATGKEAQGDRLVHFKKSEDYLNNAIAMWQKVSGPQSASEASSLWNIYLTQRDMGKLDESNKSKLLAEAIDQKMGRTCKLP